MEPSEHETIPLRMEWEIHPNDEYQSLHCTWPLPRFGGLASTDESPEAEALKKRMLSIPGVVEVYSCWRYQIGVKKGRLFSFTDIHPKVESAVREFFGADAEPATVGAAPDVDDIADDEING